MTRAATRPIGPASLTPRVGEGPCAHGRYPSLTSAESARSGRVTTATQSESVRGPTGMSPANVLDSIIEGVRADTAVREARVSLSEIKAAAAAAPPPLDVMAALR